jgi:hypothetical protein
MRLFARLAVAATLLSAAACAHATPDLAPPVVADYTPLVEQPTGPHARLYAECIQQAAGSGAYRQVIDGGEELLLFTCTGPLAQSFYNALGPHSAAMGAGFTQDGRSARSTARVQKNLIGVDYCSVDASGGDPRCVLTFNAGDFLIAGD